MCLNSKPVLFACKSLSPLGYVFTVSLENEMGPKGLKESVEETKQRSMRVKGVK